jgi:hypothetical protein
MISYLVRDSAIVEAQASRNKYTPYLCYEAQIHQELYKMEMAVVYTVVAKHSIFFCKKATVSPRRHPRLSRLQETYQTIPVQQEFISLESTIGFE